MMTMMLRMTMMIMMTNKKGFPFKGKLSALAD